MRLTLTPNRIQELARIEIKPVEIAISGEEILADLLYPEPPARAHGRS
jgi:hypothetical protein